ncbi:MAG TPA: family 1 glycosylhydrolase [Acidimicrobiales bacterium]|jgi:beta-glucosidase|nr:family 1 glycosylhydrolase [Acidimicrobiales bacterium]
MQWPDGFLWGTGASSTQCEGAAPASDWIVWERDGRLPVSGDGNGFAARFAEDFALYAGLGLTHHRLSIEWARVEPEQGVYDQDAIAHYRAILSAALEAGITPWVCLMHFTLPQWFADLGGFLVEKNRVDHWARHIAFVADTFGDLVGGWQPINETNYYATIAFRSGRRPPGHNDREEWAVVSQAMHLATAEAAVRLKQTGAPVASIFGLSGEVALDDAPETQAKAAQFRAINWDAGIGLFRDGVLRFPGRDPIERPDLAGSFDLLGFSYYATIGVAQGKVVPFPVDAPISPLGYGIDASGLGLVLDRLAAELPSTPLLVAEYGIGTDDDAVRAQYIEDGLTEVQAALARGIDVRGFFHWTGVDNYEWLHAYDVSFGIIDRDRKVRPSALVLQREATQ